MPEDFNRFLDLSPNNRFYKDFKYLHLVELEKNIPKRPSFKFLIVDFGG